ncbi:MAG: flagellar brake protein [Peptoanaerobacter stomatis]|uniref:flagellar brake protein n=1 Tax=Peptoanaerobacter stomatis TaxID=796937 RepID=UPI003F9EDA64
MASNYPKIWQNVKLVKTKITGEMEEYASKIVGIEENDIFLLETPIKQTQLVLLINGSVVNMIYMHENLGMYSVDLEVVEKIRDDNNIPLVRAKKVSDIRKIQRRNFFRLLTSMDIAVRKINGVVVENTKTVDISGGGIRLLSKQDFEINDIVRLDFQLESKEFSVDAKVVKIDYTDVRGTKEVSLQFIDILEKDRNEIIRFIFDKQREGIKKGMFSNE